MENINQVTSNLSDTDKRFIKTEGNVPEDDQEGVSTGVWPILDEEQHEHQFDLDHGHQLNVDVHIISEYIPISIELV